MKIYNWDMKIEKVDESIQEYFTPNKIYEVRNGKIIIDKEYEDYNIKFDLVSFFSRWHGEWIITRVQINGIWYNKEYK